MKAFNKIFWLSILVSVAVLVCMWFCFAPGKQAAPTKKAPDKSKTSQVRPSAPMRQLPTTGDWSIESELESIATQKAGNAIDRLIAEDVDRMVLVLPDLTDNQKKVITDQLSRIRQSDTILFGEEDKMLQKVMSSRQYEKWQGDIMKRQNQAAGDYGHFKLREVQNMLPDLTSGQEDAIFQDMARSFNDQPQSDEKVLRAILTPDQFQEWSSSAQRNK